MSEVSVTDVINYGRTGNYILLCLKWPDERPFLLATEFNMQKKVFYYLCSFKTEEAAIRFARRDMRNMQLDYGR